MRFALGEMGFRYAGFMGTVAFAVTVTRGVIASASIERTLCWAGLGLVTFAFVGWVIAVIANRLVEESVYLTLRDVLASRTSRCDSDGTPAT